MSLESRDYMSRSTSPAATFSRSAVSAHFVRSSGRYAYLSYALILLPLAIALFVASESTPYHGGYPLALIAFAFHMGAGWLFFGRGENRSIARALQTAAFTGIVGMGFLLAIQHLANTNGLGVIGRFIAYAYGLTHQSPFAASTPLLTFIGYVLSVGLLEESIKVLPVVFLIATDRVPTWRLACFVGFASGIGFGIAEGIWYHETIYNRPPTLAAALSGLWCPQTIGFLFYLVRFVTCVGFHALTTAVAAMLIHRRSEQCGFRLSNAAEVLWPVSGVIFLHGLYDALLVLDHGVAAFFTDVVLFGLFVAVVETSRGTQIPSVIRTGLWGTAATCSLVLAMIAAIPTNSASHAATDAQGVPNPNLAPPGVDLINQGFPGERPAVLTAEQKRSFEATVYDLLPRIAAVRKSYGTYSTQRRAVQELKGVIADVRVNGAKPRVIIEELKKREATVNFDVSTYNPFAYLETQPKKRVETLSSDTANQFIDELKELWQEVATAERSDILYSFPEIGPIQEHVLADRILESDVLAVETIVKELPRTEAHVLDQLRKTDRIIWLIEQLGYGSDLTDPDLGPAIAEKPSQSTYKLPPALERFQENQVAEREDERHRNEEIARARQDAQLDQKADYERLIATQQETLFRFRALLAEGKADAASSLGNQLCEATLQAKNWQVLREIAPSILAADPNVRDMTLALRAAQEGSKCCWQVNVSGHSDHDRCLEPLARVYAAIGRIEDATATQEKAIRECKDAAERERLQQDLTRLRSPKVEGVAALQDGLRKLQALLAQGDAAAASSTGTELLNNAVEAGNFNVMREIASSIVKADPKVRDLGVAIRAANEAFIRAPRTEQARCLALLAEAEFLAGATGDAIYHQQDVVQLETDPDKRRAYEETLAHYRAAEK